jgi:hypothetical protein
LGVIRRGNDVTDIFQEVEEDVRRERLEQFWKKYGDYVVAGAALVVIAVAGFELWRVYEEKQRVKASEEYSVAAEMLRAGQSNVAAEMFGKLAKSAPGGYGAVSRLQEADAMINAGNRADAIALYKQIASGNDPYLGAIARIHAGWAIVDQAPLADVKELLDPVSGSGSAWNPMVRELLAYADVRAGNINAAAKEYGSLAADKNTPDGLRVRAQDMALFLNAGGDKNVGTVPEPPHPAQTPGAKPAGAGGPPHK